MAGDWDLHAVVRGFTAGDSTASPMNNNNDNTVQDPLADLASLNFNINDEPFYFPDLSTENTNQPFEGLEEIFKDGYAFNPLPITNPNPSIPALDGFQNQQQPLPPVPVPVPVPQPQQQIEPRFWNPQAGSSLVLPFFQTPTLRPRKRRNQQKKMVRQMTQEELTADLWAWRKYGQKPIKGTPYPRNYYRCNTSKGCAARKHVERSSTNPDMFVVSCTSEHTHPRLTYRNHLSAAKARSKVSAVNKPNSDNLSMKAPPVTISKPSCSSPSNVSVSSLSPTPLMMMEAESHDPQYCTHKETIVIDDDDDEEMVDVEDAEDEEEIVLIPNEVMAEDIFKGFQELNRWK